MANKTTVSEGVRLLLDAFVAPKTRRNAEALLFNVCKWQEAKSHSEKKLKDAWAALSLEGIVSTDEDLRDSWEPGGPHIVAEEGKFSVTLKVSSGGATIDPEALAALMVKRFKVTPKQAAKAILDSRKQNANKLEKRVLEVSK